MDIKLPRILLTALLVIILVSGIAYARKMLFFDASTGILASETLPPYHINTLYNRTQLTSITTGTYASPDPTTLNKTALCLVDIDSINAYFGTGAWKFRVVFFAKQQSAGDSIDFNLEDSASGSGVTIGTDVSVPIASADTWTSGVGYWLDTGTNFPTSGIAVLSLSWYGADYASGHQWYLNSFRLEAVQE